MATWLPQAPPLDRGEVRLRASSADGAPIRIDLTALDLQAVDDVVTATASLQVPLDDPRSTRLIALDGWLRVADLARWSADLPPIALEATLGGDGLLAQPRLRAGVGWRDVRHLRR